MDGSINIDTHIDTKGWGAGISKIASSAKSTFGAIGFNVATLALGIAKVAAGIIGAGIAAVFFGIKLIEAMSRAISRSNEFGKQIAEIEVLFANIKGAIYGAFSPLISAALPYIKIVTTWLINLLNTVSQIAAALLGQSTYMAYVAGSAETAATNTGKLADNTNKAKKAAAGALASFDAINVLQQASADASGGLGGGAMRFTIEPVDSKWVEWVAKVEDVWKILKEGWQLCVEELTKRWNLFVQPLITTWIQGWSIVIWALEVAVKWIKDTFGELIHGYFASLWQFWVGVFAFWVAVFTGQWAVAWQIVKDLAQTAWNFIVSVWSIVDSWYQQNVIDPIKAGFGAALDWLGSAWARTFNGIELFVLKSVNYILGLINNIISALNTALSMLARLTGASMPSIPSIPLKGQTIPPATAWHREAFAGAAGGVFQPNAPFAAILGDQKSGVNVESPAALISQLVAEGIAKAGGGNQQITINFAGSLGALVREMKPYVDAENSRMGTSLIRGAA